MTEEQIKEELSNNFIGIIASYSKYKITKPTDTGGVDFSITYDVTYDKDGDGSTRYIQSGDYIEVQLKATTDSSVIVNSSHIKYDLEAKTYNDLIMRKKLANAPLFLILFILPINRNDWVEVRNEEISLKKYAYWFIPDDDAKKTDNTSRIRISIPVKNKVDLNTIEDWFKNKKH
ncbi:DUF4365 domain-containing protein [Pseudofulvibacter geojedonensis]|uniref:DUF4365 domain-containing protein n=1 Tax=Pseudofulvibacter geojedonensis TaxID=1123758 RepID=A0ABW3HZU7_9FLAO